jgi:hypothetical protein
MGATKSDLVPSYQGITLSPLFQSTLFLIFDNGVTVVSESFGA